MTRVRAAAAAMTPVRAASAALLLGLPLLTGCGIKPTGVIESGDAAKVVFPDPHTKGTVYFVLSDGRLAPVPDKDQPSTSATANLVRLLAGPTDEERAAGMDTRLPVTDPRKQGAGAGVGIVSPDTVEVGVPFNVAGLSEPARLQLVCTVASTHPQYRVALRGPDTDLEPARCQLDR
ncbi:hypothetical protein [Streptomyces sp. NPDC088762]|uniref:hypothetical protein n=1 Tax=Streptomyces sp. NPDC088762 TaxID=3365891 RepID=UPI0037F1CE70